MNLNELDLENFESWPEPIKRGVVAGLFVLLIFCGYWFNARTTIIDTAQYAQKETELKMVFKAKQHKAANLEQYKAQMQAIEQSLSELLQQLPEKTEVPALIEDISQQGLAAGLEFRSMKLAPEQQVHFYTELPIDIVVVGTYHALAQFISNVANLPRIVTIHNYTISPVSPNNIQTGRVEEERLLQMQLTAKTYRYTEQEPAS